MPDYLGRFQPDEFGTPTERFWEKVYKTSNCWFWLGRTTKGIKEAGYGTLSLNGKPYQAHRFSWELHHGPIPENKEVIHSCDIKQCVNPAHLLPASHKQNMYDALTKGTHRGVERLMMESCKRGHRFDEKNTHVTKKGSRVCRICTALRMRESRRKRACLS